MSRIDLISQSTSWYRTSVHKQYLLAPETPLPLVRHQKSECHQWLWQQQDLPMQTSQHLLVEKPKNIIKK